METLCDGIHPNINHLFVVGLGMPFAHNMLDMDPHIGTIGLAGPMRRAQDESHIIT